MQGIVREKNANLFLIESQDKLYQLHPSGKTKLSGVFVGDKVEFSQSITKVYERKNLLIRPPLANIDKIFIVICPKPKPDFVLVDKIMTYCYLNKIEPVLTINKCDMAEGSFIDEVFKNYDKILPIIKISAKNDDIKELEENLSGTCALAGQSAVGKSSIINAILKDNIADVGELSKKIERGKQTTRLVKLYKIGQSYLADTAGFSMLDLSMISDLDYRELSYYYPDFLEGRAKCKYRSCLHENGDCGVLLLLNQGKISKLRYENYLKILYELKNAKKY